MKRIPLLLLWIALLAACIAPSRQDSISLTVDPELDSPLGTPTLNLLGTQWTLHELQINGQMEELAEMSPIDMEFVDPHYPLPSSPKADIFAWWEFQCGESDRKKTGGNIRFTGETTFESGWWISV